MGEIYVNVDHDHFIGMRDSMSENHYAGSTYLLIYFDTTNLL